MSSHISILNRRLQDRLGSVAGGAQPRFKWCWSPDMPWYVYASDDRTVVKKCWADAPSPGGGTLGKVWLLAQWRATKGFDHHGFGEPCNECRGEGYTFRGRCQACDGKGRVLGTRVAVVSDYGYAPHFETALAPGEEPTDKLTANYCTVLDLQMSMSAEQIGAEASFDNWLAEEKYGTEKRLERDRQNNLERAAAEYDRHTGAFDNLDPGDRGGYFAFQNPETGPDAPGFFK